MADSTLLFAIVGVAVVGIVAAILLLRTQRLTRPRDRPFAASTEGETRCPECGMGNLVTDGTCISCGARLG
jgi:hypothetical protein